MTEQPQEPELIGEIIQASGGVPEPDVAAEAERYTEHRQRLIERASGDAESMTEQDKAALEAIGRTALEKQVEKQQKLQQQSDSNPE